MLSQAEEARDATKKAEVKEKVELEVAGSYKTDGFNMQDFKENLDKNLQIDKEVITEAGEGIITFPYEGYIVKVTADDSKGVTVELEGNGDSSSFPIPPDLLESNTRIIYTPDDWTKDPVKVKIETDVELGTNILQYQINEEKWQIYKAPFEVAENNTTIKARLWNGVNGGKYITDEVTKIDKNPPEIKAYIGNMLYTDPTFSTGQNGIILYDNLRSGLVSINRKEIEDSPVNSKYAIEIKVMGKVEPGYGGFTFMTQSEANKEYIIRFIAKIPEGYKVNLGSNSTGLPQEREWLTSNEGTGEWKEYVYRNKCGSTGTFSTTNFFYISGGEDEITESNPLIWQVAYATVIETTTQSDTKYIITIGSDNESGIVGYGINQSDTVEPNYTEFTATNNVGKISEELTNTGIYYVWLKDYAGNVSKYQITF